MQNKKHTKRPVRFVVPLLILCGLAIFLFAGLISIRSDLASAQSTLQTTAEYIKEQCNRFARIELASETKSLMRVTESCKQISGQIADDKTLGDEEPLEYYVRENYVSGAYLLNADGNVISEYHTEGIAPAPLVDALSTEALLDAAKHPKKRYAVRFHCDDGSEVDIAATGRVDEAGVVVAYYHTPAAYKVSFSLSVEALLSGYQMENGGTVVVSNGDTIVASNDTSLIGTSTKNIPVLKKLGDTGVSGKLTHSKGEDDNIARDFALMDRGRDFYVFTFLTERAVFKSAPRVLLFTAIIYIVIIVGASAFYLKTTQHYREEQIRTQKVYAENLQNKNEQLSATVERADRANAAKSVFLSRMSHDIRTPLNGIVGLLEIDAAHPDDMALIAANRAKMQIAANYLLSLINDILQMSKLESGEITLVREPVNLTALAREVLTIVDQRAAESGVTMVTQAEADAIKVNWVMGSPLHLRQIFLNIYSNCIKYNKVGGKVLTAFDCVGRAENTVTYRWVISDTGIGMSKEFLEHVFDPFARENTDVQSVSQGTGLGMAIVRGLVEQMKGTIEINSEKNVGSTFVITIPFDIADSSAITESEVKSACGDIAGLSLLLVEDNELNTEIAQTLLTDAGAIVTPVCNGEQAIEKFESNRPGTFDAILMDIMMPVMDGLTATRTIRALNRPDAKNIPIIAMTANAFVEDAENCFDAGMNAHLAKPLDIAKAIEVIADCCGKNNRP